MAKRTSLVRASAPIVVMPRRGGRIRHAARRAGGALRHIARRAAPHASKALPTVGITLAAAALGYINGKGYLDKLPAVGGSKAFTLGLGGYAATRFARNQHVRNLGLAALAVAAADFGRVQAGGVSGLDDSTSGDDGGQF